MGDKRRSPAKMLVDHAPGSARRLITRYFQIVYALLRHLTRNETVAEDLTQDTFMNAWQSVDSLQETDRLRPWLTKIAFNVFRHHYRREKVRNKYVVVSEEIAEAQMDYKPNPEQVMIISDRNIAIHEEIAELPPLLQHMIRLAYFEEMTPDEIAAQEGIPEYTVKNRLSRAYEGLRRKLSRRKEVVVR